MTNNYTIIEIPRAKLTATSPAKKSLNRVKLGYENKKNRTTNHLHQFL